MNNSIFLGACGVFAVFGLILLIAGLAQGNTTLVIAGIAIFLVSAFLFYTGWSERTKRKPPLRRAHQT